jgi:hypothetical protein
MRDEIIVAMWPSSSRLYFDTAHRPGGGTIRKRHGWHFDCAAGWLAYGIPSGRADQP